jgi:hypothetical protein
MPPDSALAPASPDSVSPKSEPTRFSMPRRRSPLASPPLAVAIVSALQFRTVLRGLGEKEIPRGYWTNLGVWLNDLLACVALALAMHFVASGG